jgi:glycogen operon protein
MILMGDEVRRTQLGNNNAYCQDNETSWFDWSLLEKHADVRRFVKLLNAHRMAQDFAPEPPGLTLNQLLLLGNRAWHGVKVGAPDWGYDSHSLATSVVFKERRLLLYLILNAYWEPLEFELPAGNGEQHSWHRWIDTSLDSPADIVAWKDAPAISSRAYLAAPRSVAALYARGV